MKNKICFYSLTFFFTCLTGIIDILTTNQFILSPIYLISVFIASYSLNKQFGLFLSFLSASFYLSTMLLQFSDFEPFMLWNSIMMLSIFIIVVYLSAGLKKQNRQLTKGIEEKNILIREIHHRVKNNISSIESLINLTLDSNSPLSISAIQNRIATYGLLYDKLSYSPGNDSLIQINDYLQDLMDLIFKNQYTAEMNADFKITGGNFKIDSKTAQTIGLIVNELTTNSLKYAFKEADRGSIAITLTQDDNTLSMVYSDNGMGFDPNRIKPGEKHLGMILIESLTEQLNGKMKYSFENGSEYAFNFHTGHPWT